MEVENSDDKLNLNLNNNRESEQNSPAIITENVIDQYYQYLRVRDPSGFHFQVYKRRWFLLFVICIINFANAFIWIMFSPVANETASYYHISLMQVNWLSLVFLIVSIPCGFFASWLLDTLGLRASIICAAWLNLLGSAVRNLTVFDFLPSNARFPVLLTGQVIAACGQTFVMFTPAKTAALWFKNDQRALATTLATMSNPLGILAANIMSPSIVQNEGDIPILHYLCSGLSIVGVLLSTCGIHSSVPPTPPSISAAAQSEPFFIGIKKLRKNYGFWMLAFSMGGGLALFSAYTTFLEQILCPQNYSNKFAGLCVALMIGIGTVGAVIAGLIADKTRKFAEVTKIGFLLSTLGGIAFVQFARYRNQHILIATAVGLFGCFGFAVYPTSLELAVEITYPVAEATSTGLIFISGQVQGLLLMLLFQYLAQPLTEHAASLPMACLMHKDFNPQDWTIPNLIGNGLNFLYAAVLVLFFHANYRRMHAEDRVKAENTLKGNMDSPVLS